MKLMRRLLNQKKYLLLIGCLSGCDRAPVACHHFTSQEKRQLQEQIKQVPAGTSLDGVIINYEDICAV
jgi:hypothetical protein